MTTRDTAKALSAITDTGLFENLATTVLRYANPLYADLAHTGINAEGKTRKAPVDGVTFVKGASPRHMIAVHHTTSADRGLEKKWLFDPSKVKRRPKTTTPLPDPGDLLKTAGVVEAERVSDPDMEATLVLTSTEEPDLALVSNVSRQAGALDIEVDFWTRERITDFLDINADGQWIRRKFLGTPIRRLSKPLLQDLSDLALKRLDQADEEGWVSRLADAELGRIHRTVVFVLAPSGAGKTVLCRRRLRDHRASGGVALILDHAVVEQATTLEGAIDLAIRGLEPSLEPHQSALAHCTTEAPLLLLVEDINRSADPAGLAAKILSWAPEPAAHGTPWRLLCPIWPTTWARLDHQTQKRAEAVVFEPTPMSGVECAIALEARANQVGRPISRQAAASIAQGLGNDPLLVGLYNFNAAPRPGDVITEFVERGLQRASSGFSAWQLRSGLSDLGQAMLSRRRLDPRWSELSEWGLSPLALQYLTAVATEGGVLRRPLDSDHPLVEFRHDRVRDVILSQALSTLDGAGGLNDGLVGEPFYAELLAAAVEHRPALIGRLEKLNPLALAFALEKAEAGGVERAPIIEALDRWLDANPADARAVASLRWRIGAVLGRAAGVDVAPLARHWADTDAGWIIGLRGGDLMSAIRLMVPFPPGMRDRALETAVDEAVRAFGQKYFSDLSVALPHPQNMPATSAMLRLAGYLEDPRLVHGIAALWANTPDQERRLNIRDFVWAVTRCFDPARSTALLEEVCDAWAVVAQGPEARDDASIMAGMALPQALEFRMPTAALPYLRVQAMRDDLREPLLAVLERIDDPDTIEFVIEQRASARPRLSVFSSPWERRLKDGQFPMSSASRERLETIWMSTQRTAESRLLAFRLWRLIPEDNDFSKIRAVAEDPVLAELALSARLAKGDTTALPKIVDKLDRDDSGREWEHVRHLSDPQIGAALDRALGRLESQPRDDTYLTYQLQGALMRMQTSWAETTLLNHAKAAENYPPIFQALLFVATPRALDLATRIVASHSVPRALFSNIGVRFMGVMGDHPGISRREQISGLLPFLDEIDNQSVTLLARACNGLGWFDLRGTLSSGRPRDATIAFDPGALADDLDRAIRNPLAYGLLDRVRQHLTTGACWADVRRAALDWLANQNNAQEAFDLVAEVFVHFAARDDIPTLEGLAGTSPELRAAAGNAAFEIRRRSLH